MIELFVCCSGCDVAAVVSAVVVVVVVVIVVFCVLEDHSLTESCLF